MTTTETLRRAAREFRIALAGIIYPDRHMRVEVEQTLAQLDKLGLADAEKRGALTIAARFAEHGAGDLIDVVCKIAATRRLTTEDVYQLGRRGVEIHVWPSTITRMGSAR